MHRSLLLLAMMASLASQPVSAAEFISESFGTALSNERDTVEPWQQTTIYTPRPEFEAVIRGQSPQTYDLGPNSGGAGVPSPDPYFGGGASPAPQGYASPGMMPAQPGYDPFLGSPYSGLQPAPTGPVYGLNGPQPARLGWTTHWDFQYVAPSNLDAGGEVTVFGADWAADYVFQNPNGWLWKFTPEVNYREFNFSGAGNPLIQPNGPNDPGISDNYYRLAHRFEATSPGQGPFSARFGFTPAIATDFEKQLNSQAWNFDLDATAYFRSSPTLMWVGGVLYWDRAEDFILPHAGVVWNPNQFWEIRAVYPNPRADVFIGTPFGIATWLYAGAEYSVESFQAGEIQATKPQLQVEEWRAFAGVRWEGCRFASYLDFGYAFDRKWNIHSGFGTSDLGPADAFLLRYGIRY